MPNPLLDRGLKELAKLARSKKARDKAIPLAMTYAAKIAASGLPEVQKQRAQRALAVGLARQTDGGKLTYKTLLGGQPHTVVWADGEPIAAFPEWKGDLGRELARFRRDLLEEPPQTRAGELRALRERVAGAARPRHAAVPDGDRRRTDDAGAARAGSQLQTQLWVNKRPRELAEAIAAALPDLGEAEIEWRSPLLADGYAEYSGAGFLRILELEEHQDALKGFWPARGPQWDALAVIHRPGGAPGVLLAEGKSYPGEMLKGSRLASPPRTPNRKLIESSLQWTRGELGVSEERAGEWRGELYQNANRLAHLLWLREQGVDAWLVHLLFTSDQTAKPTGPRSWEAAVREAEDRLGLPAGSAPWAGHVLLAAGSPQELAA